MDIGDLKSLVNLQESIVGVHQFYRSVSSSSDVDSLDVLQYPITGALSALNISVLPTALNSNIF